MRLFAVNADYRPFNKGHNWYYVEAQDKREAHKKFTKIVSWLDIYEVQEVDPERANEVLNDPYRYIVLRQNR